MSKKANKEATQTESSDDIRRRFEAKMAELQSQRAVKNPERAAKRQKHRQQKKAKKAASAPDKPAQSSANKPEPKLILPKILSGVEAAAKLKPRDPLPKNPKQALAKVEQRQARLAALPAPDRASKQADDQWARAIQRAQGAKVRDDPRLLHRAVKRHDKQKQAKARKWQERVEKERGAVEHKQHKRQQNIDKRREETKRNRQQKRKH